jgi:hypothetical protein
MSRAAASVRDDDADHAAGRRPERLIVVRRQPARPRWEYIMVSSTRSSALNALVLWERKTRPVDTICASMSAIWLSAKPTVSGGSCAKGAGAGFVDGDGQERDRAVAAHDGVAPEISALHRHGIARPCLSGRASIRPGASRARIK